jgi:hypothetical protein
MDYVDSPVRRNCSCRLGAVRDSIAGDSLNPRANREKPCFNTDTLGRATSGAPVAEPATRDPGQTARGSVRTSAHRGSPPCPRPAAKLARPAKPEFRETDLGRIGFLWLNGDSGFGTRAVACARIVLGFSRCGCAASVACRVSTAGEKIPAGNKKGSPAVVGIHFHRGEKKIPGSLRREDRPRGGRSGHIS